MDPLGGSDADGGGIECDEVGEVPLAHKPRSAKRKAW